VTTSFLPEYSVDRNRPLRLIAAVVATIGCNDDRMQCLFSTCSRSTSDCAGLRRLQRYTLIFIMFVIETSDRCCSSRSVQLLLRPSWRLLFPGDRFISATPFRVLIHVRIGLLFTFAACFCMIHSPAATIRTSDLFSRLNVDFNFLLCF